MLGVAGDDFAPSPVKGYFSVPKPCFGRSQDDERGVPIPLHARPDGSFTMGDEVARRFARVHCPSPPKPPSALDELAFATR